MEQEQNLVKESKQELGKITSFCPVIFNICSFFMSLRIMDNKNALQHKNTDELLYISHSFFISQPNNTLMFSYCIFDIPKTVILKVLDFYKVPS